MTAKNPTAKGAEANREGTDELRAAYQAHTLAHMLYGYITPYHGWMLQPTIPDPATLMHGVPFGEPFPQHPYPNVPQGGFAAWGMPFPFWRP